MARKISVEIVGDARSLEKAFAKSSRSAKGFQQDMDKTGRSGRRAFGGLGRAVGFAAGAIGTAGLIGVARSAFGEMAEAQKVSAQTAAVLESTGKAANVSAKQIDNLAESLMQKSGVDDEAIKSGENLLLTFTDIRNETGKGNKIFDQATRVMLDMSVALGQDTKQSAIQLGKALNDPIKGVGALRRVGVQFTDAQQDQIEALVKSGQKLRAQKIILAELRKEFGGSAVAAGQTLPGKLNILRNTVLNLMGTIATKLSPAITQLVDRLTAWLNKSNNQKRVLDTVTAAAAAVETAVRLLKGAFDALNKITGSTQRTFKLLLAAFIIFKGLKLVTYIAGMAKAMRGFAAASAAANAAGAGGAVGGAGGRFGKFGRVLGKASTVAAGSLLVAQGLRSIPGWNKQFERAGARIHDVTVGRGGTNIGVVNVIKPRDWNETEQQLQRRAKSRPHRRRGAR